MDKLRKDILEASYSAGACHIGSALSCVEILRDIFKKKRKKDLFIFSKASGICALYCLYAEMGLLDKKKIPHYLKYYPLPSKEVPGIIWSGGSLGHGLPVAVGLALADKSRNVYCLMSDGELQEGTTWESLLFIKQHKIKNLIVYVDANGIQACGKIKDILDLPWNFLKRHFRIIKTIKGRGVSFMENKPEWHYWNLDAKTYEGAIFQVSN